MREYRCEESCDSRNAFRGQLCASLIQLRKVLGSFQFRYSWNLIGTSKKTCGLSLLYLFQYPYITTNGDTRMPGIHVCLNVYFLIKTRFVCWVVLHKQLVGKVAERKWSKLWSSNVKPQKTSSDGVQDREVLIGPCLFDTFGKDHVQCSNVMDYLVCSINTHACCR